MPILGFLVTQYLVGHFSHRFAAKSIEAHDHGAAAIGTHDGINLSEHHPAKLGFDRVTLLRPILRGDGT